jgi:hypothetical protein
VSEAVVDVLGKELEGGVVVAATSSVDGQRSSSAYRETTLASRMGIMCWSWPGQWKRQSKRARSSSTLSDAMWSGQAVLAGRLGSSQKAMVASSTRSSGSGGELVERERSEGPLGATMN